MTHDEKARWCFALEISPHVPDLRDVEKRARRIDVIRARNTLCNRQETQFHGRSKHLLKEGPKASDWTEKPKEETGETDSTEVNRERSKETLVTEDLHPLQRRPTQCIFCLRDIAQPYRDRAHEYSKPNKMMDHVDKNYLGRYSGQDEIKCPHPRCVANQLTLNVQAFKRHASEVHKIWLRR